MLVARSDFRGSLLPLDENATGNYGGGLSLQQKDPGIGPIKNVKLGAINPEMARKGQSLFTSKCFVCHDLDQKKIGPPLRAVTTRRTPEFIMNMLLNTVQMQQEDSIVKNLIRTYKVPMTPPNLSTEEVRSLLEYLRSAAATPK